MNEFIPLPEDRALPEEVSKSEVTAAADVMLAMVKTSKGARMYQANNPMLGKFYQELSERAGAHIQQYGEFKLDVDRFELKYKGHVVYENSDTGESMAFRMYADGIRAIIFGEGVESWELKEFLDIVNLSSSTDFDDDMVTRLWDRGLPNCFYILEEDFHEVDRKIENELASRSQQDQLHRIYQSGLLNEVVPLGEIPRERYTLSPEESSSLAMELASDEQLHYLDDICRLLTTLVAGSRNQELFAGFMELLLKFGRNLFINKETGHALKLFAFLYRMATTAEPAEEKRRAASRMLVDFWSEDALKGLCEIIDSTDSLSLDDLKTLATMIGRSSPSTLCELMGMIEKMKMRKVVVEVTAEIAKNQPHILITYLNDPRWYLVRNIVCIFERLKCSEVLDQMVLLISHRDPRVRKEVLKYFQTVTDPKARSYLLKFLRDESAQVRIMAIQFLGRAKLQFALKPIAALVDGDDFDKTPLAEKKVIYEAIGELGGDRMLPLFRSMLTKKYLFNRGKEKEAVLCAIAALQKVRSEAALKLLEEALRTKGEEFREILGQAIHSLVAQKGTTAVEEGDHHGSS